MHIFNLLTSLTLNATVGSITSVLRIKIQNVIMSGSSEHAVFRTLGIAGVRRWPGEEAHRMKMSPMLDTLVTKVE